MKPTIGVMPLWDEDKKSLWMLPEYLDGLRSAGAVPLILPLTTEEKELDQLMSFCDGFLFTGGHDVSPKVYGEEKKYSSVLCCEKRDEMEIYVLKKAMKEDKPILGICRGIQLINAALGGKLFQDLETEHPSEICHRQKPPYYLPIHEVTILDENPLSNLLGKKKLDVNSRHHQAIKTLAPSLLPMALSSDGLAEAVYFPGAKFLWAVQWHPEHSFSVNEDSRKIFKAFVDSTLK